MNIKKRFKCKVTNKQLKIPKKILERENVIKQVIWTFRIEFWEKLCIGTELGFEIKN